MPMDQAEFSTDQVLRRDIPWGTYMTTKLITGTGLQLLRRYDKKSENYKAQLLDDDGPAYIRVFVSILRDIFKRETVEYVLTLVDELLSANSKRARLFHDKSLADEDTYEPFLRLLWKGYWFIQENSCKILSLIVSGRPKSQDGAIANGTSKSKKDITTINDVLKGLVQWLCTQDGPACIRVFVSILPDIFKKETVEYVLAVVDELLSANSKRARLFHDKSPADEDT